MSKIIIFSEWFHSPRNMHGPIEYLSTPRGRVLFYRDLFGSVVTLGVEESSRRIRRGEYLCLKPEY